MSKKGLFQGALELMLNIGPKLQESQRTLYVRGKRQRRRMDGFTRWSVSRFLDLLHDGEDKLKNVEDFSPEQKTAILAEV